jgi:hypothetical protein
MADVARLTIVEYGEAEVICGLLRAHDIDCMHRPAEVSAESVGTFGEWREILVGEDELEAARELLAAPPAI